MTTKHAPKTACVLYSIIFSLPVFCSQALAFEAEERIALEQELSRRVEGITRAVLGTRQVFVWVEILTKDKPQMRKHASQEMGVTLPGIDPDYMPVTLKPQVQTFKLPADFVQRLTVNILVSDNISLKRISELRRILASTIGIDEERGDKLIIEPIPFKKGGFDENTPWKIAVVPMILWTAGLGIFAVFLFGPVSNFLKNFSHERRLAEPANSSPHNSEDTLLNSTDLSNVSSELPAPSSPSPGTNAETSRWTLTKEFPRETALLPSHTEPAYNPFSFVNGNNIGNLCLLLHEESPEIISIVTNYLAPDLSARLINSLSGEIRSQVVSFMVQPRLLEKDEVKGLARSIKENVELICGGISHVTKIMERADPETRENLLQFLENELPEIALQIRRIFASESPNVT